MKYFQPKPEEVDVQANPPVCYTCEECGELISPLNEKGPGIFTIAGRPQHGTCSSESDRAAHARGETRFRVEETRMKVEYLDATRITDVKITDVPRTNSRSGYGARLPTRYMVQLDNRKRWHRVYVMQFSNAGSAYIIDHNEIKFINGDAEYTIKNWAPVVRPGTGPEPLYKPNSVL